MHCLDKCTPLSVTAKPPIHQRNFFLHSSPSLPPSCSFAMSSKRIDNREPTNGKRVVDPETERLSLLDLKQWIVEFIAAKPESIECILDGKAAFQKNKEQRKALKKGTKSGEVANEIQLI